MRFLHILTEYWRRTPWQVILLLFAVPFLIRNLLLPMVGDDFSYAFIWNGDDLGNLMDDIGPRERIHSFYDILVSQWSHYFTWGGRTPSMIIIQLFAWLGKIWFGLANTIVFTLLMLILYWISVGNTVSPARHKGVFFWVMAGMLFGVIDYISTMLWCVLLGNGRHALRRYRLYQYHAVDDGGMCLFMVRILGVSVPTAFCHTETSTCAPDGAIGFAGWMVRGGGQLCHRDADSVAGVCLLETETA